jgi:hypothetical protein
MTAIGSVFSWPSTRARHSGAPLLREREQFLQHLLQQGTSRSSVRNTAALLLRTVEFLDLKEMRPVGRHETEAACLQWKMRQLAISSFLVIRYSSVRSAETRWSPEVLSHGLLESILIVGQES